MGGSTNGNPDRILAPNGRNWPHSSDAKPARLRGLLCGCGRRTRTRNICAASEPQLIWGSHLPYLQRRSRCDREVIQRRASPENSPPDRRMPSSPASTESFRGSSHPRGGVPRPASRSSAAERSNRPPHPAPARTPRPCAKPCSALAHPRTAPECRDRCDDTHPRQRRRAPSGLARASLDRAYRRSGPRAFPEPGFPRPGSRRPTRPGPVFAGSR